MRASGLRLAGMLAAAAVGGIALFGALSASPTLTEAVIGRMLAATSARPGVLHDRVEYIWIPWRSDRADVIQYWENWSALGQRRFRLRDDRYDSGGRLVVAALSASTVDGKPGLFDMKPVVFGEVYNARTGSTQRTRNLNKLQFDTDPMTFTFGYQSQAPLGPQSALTAVERPFTSQYHLRVSRVVLDGRDAYRIVSNHDEVLWVDAHTYFPIQFLISDPPYGSEVLRFFSYKWISGSPTRVFARLARSLREPRNCRAWCPPGETRLSEIWSAPARRP